jgi:hypothetical protein
MSLSDEEIIEVAKQLYGDDLTEAQLRDHKTIAFARRIAAKQREDDAALCEQYAWGSSYRLRDTLAAAIRGQK